MRITISLAVAASTGCLSAVEPVSDGDGSSGDGLVASTPAQRVYGAYALFPSDPSILATPDIDGAFVQFAWSKLQTTNARPDFTAIDTWLDAAVANHRRLTIGIRAGSATPAWVYGGDASQYLALTEYAFQQQKCEPNQIVPIPWKSKYLSAFTSLVDAFAAHVYSNPQWVTAVAGIKITGINNASLETSLPYTTAQTHGACTTTDAPSAWRDAGYTEDLVNAAWSTILPHFATGFPRQALIMDYIDLGFPAEYENGHLQPRTNAVSTLLVTTATAMLGTRQFVIEGTGLSDSGGPAPNLDNYAATGGAVGYQELYFVDGAPAPCVMSDPKPGTNGVCNETVLHDALTFGIAHHMRYVELYTEDIAGYPAEVAFAHRSLAP